MADLITQSPPPAALDPQILSTTDATPPASPTPDFASTATGNPTTPNTTEPSTTAQPASGEPTPSSSGNQVAVLSTLDYSTTQTVTTVQQITNNTVTHVTNNYYTTPAALPANAAAATTASTTTPAAAAAADPLLRRPGLRLHFHSRQYGEGGRVDRIIGFNSDAGDQLTLAAEAFPGIGSLSYRSVSSRRSLRKAARSDADILYLQSSGELFFNANGSAKGFGSDGGLFAVLEGKPALTMAQLLMG